MRTWRQIWTICWSLSVGLWAAASAADLLPPEQYVIKQDAPQTGSHLARREVFGFDVPINRRYSDLTDEQKSLIKSRYEAMHPLDEPPYPIDGLKPVLDAVRKIHEKLLEQGELVIFVDIDASGHASRASIIKSPDERMARAIAEVLMLTQYKPALCRGVPCAMGYPFRMTFTVER